MKKLLAILLVALIIFTGCNTTDVSSEISSDVTEISSSTASEDNSSEPSSDITSSVANSYVEAFTTDDIDPVFKTEYSKKPIEVTEEDLKYLELQAPILTEHLLLSLQNLDIDFDKDEINQFLGLLANFDDKPEYRYTPIMSISQDRQYFLFCFEDVNRTAYEVFGKREWTFETLNMKVDKEHGVYAEEFGYGLYIPYFGTNFETTVTDTTVEVEFTLYRHGEKDGDPYEFNEGRYAIRYSIIKDEAGAFLRFDWIGEKPSSKEPVKLTSAKGEITNCTAGETAEYLKTDEAMALATHFGTNMSIKEFSNTSEIVDSAIFFRFMQDILPEIGTIDDNADVVVVEKSVADGYLEKYFGIKEYDPKENSYYDKYSGQYHFPWATEKSMWIVQAIELESIEQNECTFRYVYSYVANEPPYYSARITFEVMKDENGAFLQAVSCTDAVSEVATIQEAIYALYSQNLEWQSITCEVPTFPVKFTTEDGYKHLEIPKSDGNKAVTFKLPKGFYPTENTEGDEGKSWTDGNFKVNVSGVYEMEYLQERMSVWPDAFACRRTFLDNGIVDTILYPRKDYAADEPSARSHFACIDCGDVIVSFEVSEPWYIDTPTMTTETLSMIKAIADSFE